jgi:hypothetical protein
VLKINADVEGRRTATRGRLDGQSITLQPIDSAARQLVQLALHYLVNQPERICVVGRDAPLPDAGTIAASPRMIAFVDVPPGTRFLPQAAELNDGRVVTFFSPLAEALKTGRRNAPGGLSRKHSDGRRQTSAGRVLEVVRRSLERRHGGQGRGGCHRGRRPASLDRLPYDVRQRHDAAPGCVRSW